MGGGVLRRGYTDGGAGLGGSSGLWILNSHHLLRRCLQSTLYQPCSLDCLERVSQYMLMTTQQTTSDLDSATYNVIDCHTGAVIRAYAGTKRKAARNYAERLNQGYGAHRYTAQPVFTAAQ